MKTHRIRMVLSLFFALALLAGPAGTLGASADEPAGIAGLLPVYESYRWGVTGFVDYGHDLWVTSIELADGETVVHLEGAVHDLSDGESDADFAIRMQYRIRPEVLIQIKDEEVMMDSEFDRLELIRSPLEEGTSWTQEVTGSDGSVRTLESAITQVTGRPGSRVFTVRYEDRDSSYYEERRIGEGEGVLSFERLMQGEEEDYLLHYAVFDGATGADPDREFPDVDPGDWYAGTVGRLTAMDLLTGYPDGIFGPGREITVAEFITVTVETLGFQTDAPHEIWYRPYMDEAVRLDLVRDGEFDRADRPITREEMTKVIVRALDLPVPTENGEVFTDTGEIDPDLRTAVHGAWRSGLISGYPDGSFRPQGLSTRAEAGVLLTRIAERLGSQVAFERSSAVQLEEDVIGRLFHETTGDWVVTGFDSKDALVDHLAVVVHRPYARELVETFYEIRNRDLVLPPREGLVQLMETEAFRLERVSPLRIQLVQEAQNDMIGPYTLTVTYRMGSGRWLMESRDVQTTG